MEQTKLFDIFLECNLGGYNKKHLKMKISLKDKIDAIKGIGNQKVTLINKELGINTVEEMLNYFPFRYEDRSQIYEIANLSESNLSVSLQGEIIRTSYIGIGSGKRFLGVLKDNTGEIDLLWFKGISWVGKTVKRGVRVKVFGKPTVFNGKLNIVHPEIEHESINKETKSIVPVYRSTELLTRRYLNSKGIAKIQEAVAKETEGLVEETLPSNLIKEENLVGKAKAMFDIHVPKSVEAAENAIYRLKIEELFYLQLRLLKEKKIRREERAPGYEFTDTFLLKSFYKSHLPYTLTQAQKKVLKEIHTDLSKGVQMNRLIQGDVGSGKTIVAFMSMLIAISSGYQVAMMAPTEILAEQHYKVLKGFFQKLDIKIALLTGSTKQKARRELSIGLELGNIKVLFGTHALIEDKVKFKNLGLAIIDEQHRFGVLQRAKLWKKNENIPPHILVMTATPIPRTLAMTLYGNLDVSVIDELPKGRKPIKTFWYTDSSRLKIFGLLNEQLKMGKQAYVVYPLIEESLKLDYKNLMDGYESVTRAFPSIPIGVLHGQMDSKDKEYEMERFKKGETKIMVATTVIEVGVDVPNASIMIIESAERFGLSQLHQLRGRVGRSSDQSYCVLVSGNKLSKEGKQRLKVMAETNDGFEIANHDLKLRGPGDLLGAQQSGILDLKISDLAKDEKILNKARKAAIEILKDDPNFLAEKNKRVRKRIEFLENKETNLMGIS